MKIVSTTTLERKRKEAMQRVEQKKINKMTQAKELVKFRENIKAMLKTGCNGKDTAAIAWVSRTIVSFAKNDTAEYAIAVKTPRLLQANKHMEEYLKSLNEKEETI